MKKTCFLKSAENYLSEKILQLGGFESRGNNVDINLNNGYEETKMYLGTYFLRSFSESYNITTDLLNNKTIFDIWSNKSRIRILDVGSGTGGNLLGLVSAFIDNGINNIMFDVISVDGNKIALDYQKEIVDGFQASFGIHINIEFINFTFDKESIGNTTITDENNEEQPKFDFIMSFKFISELMAENKMYNHNFYYDFVRSFEDNIAADGVFLILDISGKNYDGIGKSNSQIMTRNINKYTSNRESKLLPILPVPCFFWHRICKTMNCFMERRFGGINFLGNEFISRVCYRVLAHKEFANKVYEDIESKSSYQMNFNNQFPSYCESGKKVNITNQNFYHNAYVLTGK